MVKKKSDEQILFSDIVIDDITVKPWAFGILFELSESLDIVLDKAANKGVLDNIVDESGSISYITMARIFALANEEILSIISITIDKSVDEIKNFKMDKGIKVALTIFNQNRDVIKNAFSSTAK